MCELYSVSKKQGTRSHGRREESVEKPEKKASGWRKRTRAAGGKRTRAVGSLRIVDLENLGELASQGNWG